MSTMIQIRNVPDALHRRLKSRAALAGMSLSDYLLQQIREVAERPTIEGDARKAGTTFAGSSVGRPRPCHPGRAR
jgi:plasmid stability protein